MKKAHNRLNIDDAYVVQAYKSGKTAREVGDELGVDKSVILTRLREAGVERRKQSTYPELTKEILEDMYVTQKLSNRSIAKIIGCSKNLVNKRLGQFEIPIRKRVGDPSFTEAERKAKWGRPREEHNLWKGGVTGINETLRGATEEWRKAELRRNNFTCYVSGIRAGDMHVHHVTPFHVMRDEMVAELGIDLRPTIADYSELEVEVMRERIAEMHEEERGFVLAARIHKLFHTEYGFNTDLNDLEEFKMRFNLGEFDDSEAVA